MAELWRVIPKGATKPTGVTFETREALDKSLAELHELARNKTLTPGTRMAAHKITQGRIEVAANVVWVEVND